MSSPTVAAAASDRQTSQIVRLTDQFYAWERRGRGWHVWPGCVELEPPFEPFRVGPAPGHAVADDGQRPTFLSKLTKRLLSALTRPAFDSSSGIDTPDHLHADLDEGPESVVELELSMPPEADVSLEQVEQCLLSIARPKRPFAFEVVGTADAIWTQLACAEEDSSSLAQGIRAWIPGAAVSKRPTRLEAIWGQAGDRTVVAELGLADEFMLPLKTQKGLAADPLSGIAAALSSLAEGEVGVLQVLWAPVRHPWAASISKAVLDGSGSPFFLDAPDVTAMARQKVSRPLFACLIRVAANTASSGRSLLIARSLSWSLNVLSNPPGNRLIPLHNEEYPNHAHEDDLLGRRTRRSGMILSSSELVSLVHPPSASVRVEGLVRSAASTRAAPAIATGHPISLGVNSHAGVALEVGLSADQRSRHLYVIGASGTGKSTLLLNLILQDLARGEGLAVLDPHGDLIDEVLRRVPGQRLSDVVLLDPADADHPIGFNILSAHSELERTLLASDLVAVFRRLSTSWGDQMTSVLGNAILALLESDRGGTLVDLRRFLVEAEFRREFLQSVRDKEVVYYWLKEFPLLAGKPQAPILTRLDTFLRPKPIRYMVAQYDTRLDLRAMMDKGKILLARLSQGAIGEENAFLLGTLIVSKLQQLAMSRQDLAAAKRRPFYLYVDEFHNFVTPSMEAILSGARKYGLSLILAHQDLRQIQSRSPEVLHAVLSNPYARICFRVGDHDAKTLAEGFSHFGPKDLQSLGTGQAIARIERAEFDFNLATPPLPPLPSGDVADDVAALIVASSRTRFGRSRLEVESLLEGRSAGVDGDASSVQAPSSPTTGRHPRSPRPTPPAEPVAAAPSDVERPTRATAGGRGGAQHRYLQELIRRWAEANGWRAGIEEPVLGGLGSVDVALRKGERAVACEIGVTTRPEHEVDNIQKCLTAGFGRVVFIAAEPKTLVQVKGRAATSLTGDQVKRVSYFAAEEILTALDSLETDSANPTVRGYKVKVRLGSAGVGQGTEKQAVVSRVIATAIRRLSRKP